MDIRIVRDTKKMEDEETGIRAATTWATLIQEITKDAWGMTDEQVAEMVNVATADLLNYETTHDEWGNAVNAIEVRLGKGGYSASTVFDDLLPISTNEESGHWAD